MRVSFLISTSYRWKDSSPEGIRDLSRIMLLVRTRHFYYCFQLPYCSFCLLSLCVFQGSFLSSLFPIAFANFNHYHNLKACKHFFQVQPLYSTQDSHLQLPTGHLSADVFGNVKTRIQQTVQTYLLTKIRLSS